MSTRKAYPSDVTRAEWRRLEPLIPRVKPGGRPGKYERREILNGMLYQMRTGCSWRSLPDDLPPWKIVHHYLRTWRDDWTWERVIEAVDGPMLDAGSMEREAATAGIANPSRRPVGHGAIEDSLPTRGG